jgi:hypothetical protein
MLPYDRAWHASCDVAAALHASTMQAPNLNSLPDHKGYRRLFVLHELTDGHWLVTAEGATDEHRFGDRGLALGYAGLWASANAPSQLIERRADGTLGTLKEYD